MMTVYILHKAIHQINVDFSSIFQTGFIQKATAYVEQYASGKRRK